MRGCSFGAWKQWFALASAGFSTSTSSRELILAARSVKEAIHRFLVRALGLFGFGQGSLEVAVEFHAPGVYLGPGHHAAFDDGQA